MKIPFLPTLLCLVHSFILFAFLPQTSAQFDFLDSECGDIAYSSNSTYQSNLKTVLDLISSDNRITNGYYNFTAGQNPDTAKAMVLCRGNAPVSTCRLCARNSVATLLVKCPNKKEAFGYTDNCIIFYSNNFNFHSVRVRPGGALWNNRNVSYMSSVFNTTLKSLMSNLQNQASLGNSDLKVAAGQTNLTGTNKTMYGLVQCSPQLSRATCVVCVQYLISSFFYKVFVTSTFVAAGARVISPSCNLRYEIYPFYHNETDVSSPPAPAPATTQNSTTPVDETSRTSKRTIAIIMPVIGSLVLFVILASICICIRKKKQKMNTKNLNKEEIGTVQSLQYSLRAIKVATNDFSNENYLGKGGFGTVYKGKLPDEQEIAVKRLARKSVQGEIQQFENEIMILAKLQHRNLVRLLGFCLEGEEMLLIYEFVINKSLDNFLFDAMQGESMPWETRYKIIIGIARGLLYLHEGSRLRIIHRDLKAGNVLLDTEFNPKIADFGMARLFKMDQTHAKASKIVGTYGYMAPEYVQYGHVSLKSDVFSFGVLVLEIISGQRICSFQIGENLENMLTFAWKNWLEGKAWDFVDPTLSSASSTEILRCMHIGLLCVQHNMAERPAMSSVDLMLSSASLCLKVPSQPAFFTRGNIPANSSDQSDRRLLEYSINNITVTQIQPR